LDRRLDISEVDVGYVFDELHFGRSVVAPTYVVPAKPQLIRWSRDEPLVWDNLVAMDRSEANKHEKEVLVGGRSPREVWGDETADLVERRRATERALRKWKF
jgi:hypothetical protein